MPDLKECFVISPIGEEGSPTRKAADYILKYVIEPAVSPLGYLPLRGDGIEAGGEIAIQVIEHILDAPLVIANLQDNNPNVYYEMAVRHTTGKPLIPLSPQPTNGAKKGAKGKDGPDLAFNVRGIRTARVDLQDPASVEQAKKEIQGQVRAFEKDPKVSVNPVSTIFMLRELKRQQETTDRMRSLSEELQQQIHRLGSLSQQIADYTRKPLKGIPEILVACYDLLKKTPTGSRLWLVGMTLGLGPPHRFRHARPGRPSGSIERDLKQAGADTTDVEVVIRTLNENLVRIVAASRDPTIVCLDPGKLRGAFLDKLATRPSYKALTPQIGEVEAEIRRLHADVAAQAARPVRYSSSLPLQLLIVEKGEGDPGGAPRRAALVFHVGSENIDAKLMEDGELGFYTEIDPVVDMFATMAESLYETATAL